MLCFPFLNLFSPSINKTWESNPTKPLKDYKFSFNKIAKQASEAYLLWRPTLRPGGERWPGAPPDPRRRELSGPARTGQTRRWCRCLETAAFRTLDTWLSDHKSVLSWEQGLFRAEQFAVWVLFTGIARQCGIQIDNSSRLSVKFILCQEWKLRETENDAFPREALFSLKHATEPSKLDLHLTVHSLVIYSWLCWRGLLRLKNVKLKVKVNIQMNYSKSQMNCSI